jgi:hypothetical protein
MIPVTLKFYRVGRRWFSCKKINKGYSERNFPHLFDDLGQQRKEEEASLDDGSENDFEDDDSLDFGQLGFKIKKNILFFCVSQL